MTFFNTFFIFLPKKERSVSTAFMVKTCTKGKASDEAATIRVSDSNCIYTFPSLIKTGKEQKTFTLENYKMEIEIAYSMQISQFQAEIPLLVMDNNLFCLHRESTYLVKPLEKLEKWMIRHGGECMTSWNF